MSQPEGNDSFNEPDGEVKSLLEFIDDHNAEIEQASLLLAASDADTCTYSMGYLKRQALYACLTCTEEEKWSGALCLPCADECHKDHDLISLWTKRNYRCDCGTDKFTSKCKLEPIKPEANDLNVYNHNFKGFYCICERPYPDSDNTDEMIQCIVCEDWFHSKHLGTKDVNTEDYFEMICSGCTSKLSFLPAYQHLIAIDSPIQNLEKDDETEHVDVVDTECKLEVDAEKLKSVDASKEMKSEASSSTCKISKLINAKDLKQITGSSFWIEGWRQELCRCLSCNELYKSEGVPFITDEQDTLQTYENISRERITAKEQQKEEALSQALSSMDRVAAMEIAHQFNQFKEDLSDWLNSCGKNGRVVEVNDVNEFMSGLQARKRARKDDGIPPSFCR